MRLSIFISTVFIFFLTSPAIAQNETEQETDKIKPVPSHLFQKLLLIRHFNTMELVKLTSKQSELSQI